MQVNIRIKIIIFCFQNFYFIKTKSNNTQNIPNKYGNSYKDDEANMVIITIKLFSFTELTILSKETKYICLNN